MNFEFCSFFAYLRCICHIRYLFLHAIWLQLSTYLHWLLYTDMLVPHRPSSFSLSFEFQLISMFVLCSNAAFFALHVFAVFAFAQFCHSFMSFQLLRESLEIGSKYKPLQFLSQACHCEQNVLAALIPHFD